MRKFKTGKISDDRVTLWQFIERKADRKKALGCLKTADNYLKFSKSLTHFLSDEQPALYLEDVTEQFVQDYESYLKHRGLNISTQSFYNRIFRSLYNQAAQDGLIKNAHPFDGVYTKVTSPRKYSKVMTPEGSVPLESLPKEDIIRRYTLLSVKYNTLVERISGLVKV